MLARWREPAEPAHKIALRRLDFDDLCAILTETPGAPRADYHAGEIQDTNALKWLPGRSSFAPSVVLKLSSESVQRRSQSGRGAEVASCPSHARAPQCPH